MESICDYRKELQLTTDHLQQHYEKWNSIVSDSKDSLPEDFINRVNVALGKVQLLTRGKLRQFSQLLDEKENESSNTRAIRIEDIQGFWDMVVIQVKQVEGLCEELNTLKNNGFKEEESATSISRRKCVATSGGMLNNGTAAAGNKAVYRNNKNVSHASSSKNLKAFIAAQKQKQKSELNGDGCFIATGANDHVDVVSNGRV